MSLFFYILNILLIVMGAVAVYPSIFLYLKTKNSIHKWFGCILICIISELAVLEYHSLVFAQDSLYVFYERFALIRIVLSTIVFFCEYFLLLSLFEKKSQIVVLLFLLFYPIISVIMMLQMDSILTLWLYFSLRQITRFAFLLLFLYWNWKKEKINLYIEQFNRFLIPAFLLNITIMIEDSLTIPQISVFFHSTSGLRGRNMSELLLWSGVILVYLFIVNKELSLLTLVRQHGLVLETKVGSLSPFVQQYKLTPREAEVVELLAQNESTASIASSLYISSGTLKTHLHNIYSKTETANRIELLRLLTDFLHSDIDE